MSKRKTHEEYVNEVSIKNPNVEVIDQYIDAKTKIMHHCLIHDIFWEIKPESVLLGSGCKNCKKEKLREVKTKNNEQYIHEVESVNPYIIVLEQYIDAKTPILHKCLKHDTEWKTIPDVLLRGCGCPQCCKEKIGNSLRKGHDEYVNSAALINQNVEVVGEYKGSHIKLLHKCKIDGYEWETEPNAILSGCGCPVCGKNISTKKRIHTYEDYIKKLFAINPNIEVVGEYVNSQTNILHRCKIDGYEWMLKPNNALNGYGCPVCAGNMKKTTTDYIQELSLINPNIEVIEEYIQATIPILHKCKIDGYEWKALPSNILHGSGCPKCNGGIKKMHKDYEHELSIINPDIEVIEEYVNASTPILHKCKIDGNIWFASPSNILSGRNCPQCAESCGERNIRQWLEKHNIEYLSQHSFDDCKDYKSLPFDFYIKKLNICIEYDGKQHFEPVDFAGKGEKWARKMFEYTLKHDNIKNEYCKNNGISLLRIPYFKNVEEELNNFFIYLI